MSEAVSALQGAVSEGFARIEETGLRGMITLRCDLASGALAKALKAVLGAKVPGQRRIVDGAGGRVAWMSPDELLILCAHDRAQAMVGELAAALGREHALVVNVSMRARCSPSAALARGRFWPSWRPWICRTRRFNRGKSGAHGWRRCRRRSGSIRMAGSRLSVSGPSRSMSLIY